MLIAMIHFVALLIQLPYNPFAYGIMELWKA